MFTNIHYVYKAINILRAFKIMIFPGCFFSQSANVYIYIYIFNKNKYEKYGLKTYSKNYKLIKCIIKWFLWEKWTKSNNMCLYYCDTIFRISLYWPFFVKNNNIAIVKEKISYSVYFMCIKDEHLYVFVSLPNQKCAR